jgi:hypothetical protein
VRGAPGRPLRQLRGRAPGPVAGRRARARAGGPAAAMHACGFGRGGARGAGREGGAPARPDDPCFWFEKVHGVAGVTGRLRAPPQWRGCPQEAPRRRRAPPAGGAARRRRRSRPPRRAAARRASSMLARHSEGGGLAHAARASGARRGLQGRQAPREAGACITTLRASQGGARRGRAGRGLLDRAASGGGGALARGAARQFTRGWVHRGGRAIRFPRAGAGGRFAVAGGVRA